MRIAIRRSLTVTATTWCAATLLALPAGAAQAGPVDPPEPGNCAERVSGTLTANASTVGSGSPVTVSWSGRVTTPLCSDEVTFRVGTASVLASEQVAATGAKVFRPLVGTTFHLYAVYPGGFKSVASRYVGITGEARVEVSINQLQVVKAQESSGDEPWLMIFPIFADGTTIDAGNLASASARVMSAPGTHGMLGVSSVRTNTVVNVPPAQGRFSTVVQPVRNLPAPLADRMSIVGFAVIALEEDETPTTAAVAGRNAARSALTTEINTLIRELREPTSADITRMHARVAEAATAAVVQETVNSWNPMGFIDPDDVIGAGFRYLTLEQIKTSSTGTQSFAIPVEGQGASYIIRGTISRT
ncbi:hypothetical protein ACIBMZ_15990 [Micromonospora sp. NPDC049900]|uniref:hypothetical protein n=1 Tax=Micromonospora sp. NPDC049900 TaxID=3364275 RepID=UPI003797C4E5